jgi:hypothetical protein
VGSRIDGCVPRSCGATAWIDPTGVTIERQATLTSARTSYSCPSSTVGSSRSTRRNQESIMVHAFVDAC